MKNCLVITIVYSAIIFLAHTSANAEKLADIRERGFIKVGISLGGLPMGGRDNRNNPIGYDVDFANQFAEALGVELRITTSMVTQG